MSVAFKPNDELKLDIVIPENHRVELELPEDLPTGPAEVVVRVTTRSGDKTTSETPPQSLADLFAGRVGLIDSGGSEHLSRGCGEKFTDYLESKRRNGSL